MTPANVDSWVIKTVWQRIPGRRSRNSETPTTIAVHSITRNDQVPLTGGLQMLTTDDICNCSSRTAELFHEDIGTPARRAWIVLGQRYRASGVRTPWGTEHATWITHDVVGRTAVVNDSKCSVAQIRLKPSQHMPCKPNWRSSFSNIKPWPAVLNAAGSYS